MGYDALGMGEWEVRFIKESSRAMPYGDSIPMICANIVDSSTGKLLVPAPYIVKKTPSGLKVGIISVVGDNLLDPQVQANLQIRIVPPAEALRKYVKDLRKKCDLVILLSHTQIETTKQLASEIPGIDIVLGGHASSATSETLEQIGSVTLMRTKSLAKQVGKLVLDINADRKIVSATGEYVAMGSDIGDDPDMVKLVAQHDKDLAGHYERMRTRAANATQSYQLRDPRPFVSSVKCRECHAKEYGSWLSTGHAKAFASLSKDNRTSDPECLSCHTTGFKSKGGFRSAIGTPQLGGVQCEVCHGPGVMHVRRPGKGYGAVLQSSCTQCHDSSKSPNFDFNAYKDRIAHPKEETGGQPPATTKD